MHPDHLIRLVMLVVVQSAMLLLMVAVVPWTWKSLNRICNFYQSLNHVCNKISIPFLILILPQIIINIITTKIFPWCFNWNFFEVYFLKLCEKFYNFAKHLIPNWCESFDVPLFSVNILFISCTIYVQHEKWLLVQRKKGECERDDRFLQMIAIAIWWIDASRSYLKKEKNFPTIVHFEDVRRRHKTKEKQPQISRKGKNSQAYPLKR